MRDAQREWFYMTRDSPDVHSSEYTDTKISLEESRKEMSQKEKEFEQKLKSVKKKKEKV